MTTECTTERLEFERFRRQRVVGRFDGGELGSDGGGLLLRELAQRTGLFGRLSACFREGRRQVRASFDGGRMSCDGGARGTLQEDRGGHRAAG